MAYRWIAALAVLALGATAVWRVQAQSPSPSFSINASSLIQQVAAGYGERHPHVLTVEKTFTDPPPHEPMYFVHLAGRFRRGRTDADELYFSALADRRFIWGIAGYRGKGVHRHGAWMDCQRPCMDPRR